MIKVTELINDGVWLSYGDKVRLLKSKDGFGTEVFTLTRSDWIGNRGGEYLATTQGSEDLEGWYLVEFAERKNTDYVQPVPDWVAVEVKREEEPKSTLVSADEVCWLNKFNAINTWRPDLEYLTEHYKNKDRKESWQNMQIYINNITSDSKNKEDNDSIEVIAPKEDNNSGISTTEAPVYTKEMLEHGMMPEREMLVCFGGDNVVVNNISWSNGEQPILNGIKINTDCGGYGYLHELVFPETESPVEKTAKFLYYKHMDIPEEGNEFMWEQCSDYKNAWLLIAKECEEQ